MADRTRNDRVQSWPVSVEASSGHGQNENRNSADQPNQFPWFLSWLRTCLLIFLSVQFVHRFSQPLRQLCGISFLVLGVPACVRILSGMDLVSGGTPACTWTHGQCTALPWHVSRVSLERGHSRFWLQVGLVCLERELCVGPPSWLEGRWRLEVRREIRPSSSCPLT